MNKVLITGRLTKDSELKYTEKQTPIATFSVAVERQYKNDKGQTEADFINCKAFSKTAEVINKYTKKGDLVGIIGNIQTGSYEKDGKKVYTTDVIVETIEFLQTKPKQEEKNKQEETPKNDPYKDFGQQIEIDDSNLPF